MNTLLFFSNNQNKIKEVKNIFSKNKIKILSLNDFPAIVSPKESGNSFVKNAKIKSYYGYKKFGIPCFADDSGICISALKNNPGVHSKKFLEKFKNKKQLFDFIIKKTKLHNNTNAFFETSICLTTKLNHFVFFQGKSKGSIAEKPKGLNGFGYDPIFIPNDNNITFAEMSTNQKNILSHRSIAINKLINFLVS